MIDFEPHITALIDALETGLSNHESEFGDPVTGPQNFELLTYPCIHIIPDTASYQDGGEYAHTCFVNYYFEFDRNTDYLDLLGKVGDTTKSAMTSMAEDPKVVEYKPTNVDHFAGENAGNLLVGIQLEFRVTTLIDFAE